MSQEQQRVVIREEYMLDKFDGEPLPENLVERLYLDQNGKITKQQYFVDGQPVETGD